MQLQIFYPMFAISGPNNPTNLASFDMASKQDPNAYELWELSLSVTSHIT